MLRDPSRWQTPFASWVCERGVYRVIEGLAASGHPVTDGAVYHWVAGRSLPHPRIAARLCAISAGELTLRDVYRPALEAEGLLDVR